MWESVGVKKNKIWCILWGGFHKTLVNWKEKYVARQNKVKQSIMLSAYKKSCSINYSIYLSLSNLKICRKTQDCVKHVVYSVKSW